MTRSGLVDSGLSLANTVMTVASAFVTFRLVSRYLGAETFGLWALAGAALFPLKFADLSINSAVLRYLGVAEGQGMRRVILRVVAAAIGINLAAFALFAVVSWFVTPELIRQTVAPDRWGETFELVPYLVLAALCQLIAGVFSAATLGLHRYRIAYLAGMAVAVLQIAFVYPMIEAFGIAGYALLQAALFVAQAALLGLLLLLYREAGAGDREASFDLSGFLGFAFKLNANAVLATLIEPLAKLLLGRFGTLSLVGAYEIVLRIYAQVRLVSIAPMQPFAILMIRHRAHDRAGFRDVYELSLLYAVAVATLMLASILPALHLFRAWIELADPALPLVVACVACSTAIAFVAVPAYNAAIAAGEVKPILACTVIYLALLGVPGFLAGRLWGGAGVLATSVVAILISNAALVVMVGKSLEFPPFPARGRLRRHWLMIRQAMPSWSQMAKNNFPTRTK